MEKKLPGSQHFYKIMMPGYDTQLPLPKACCQKLNGLHSGVATITSCKGKWEVELKKDNNELISFGRGWETFFHEHDLRLGTFILFEHRGSMHFTAKVFDLTACEKEFPLNATHQHVEITGEELTKKRTQLTNKRTRFSSYFRTVIKPAKDNRVYIPRAFARAHGLSRRKKSIILRDSAGEEWTIELLRYSQKRVAMKNGWSDFCKSNQIKEGDSCTFRFRESPDRKEFALDVCISRA